jgi:hypothetical protein
VSRLDATHVIANRISASRISADRMIADRMVEFPVRNTRRRGLSAPTFLLTAATLIAVLLSAACAGPSVHTPSGVTLLPDPDPASVASVIFLLGDAGEAIPGRSPLLERMRDDVEWWSERLESDSTVTVLVLGDNVYPRGLRAPEDEERGRDSLVIMGQLDLVTGPEARSKAAYLYFLTGNHDWGLREDWEGYIRVRRLEDFVLAQRLRTGVRAEVTPAPGSGGPVVIDRNDHYRLLILDTPWWLLSNEAEAHTALLKAVDEAFVTAGDREILIAAHHPFRAGGPHGGNFSFWETLGARYLLFRSGAILQDISSRPYRDLERGLQEIFRRHGPPLAFIGGHEHSLQLLEAVEPTDPSFSIVSGAGSKLSSIGPVEGMLFGQSAPGYMRMIFEKNGGVTLSVVSAPEQFQHCPSEEEARVACMEAGISAYNTVFSKRLR